jgi:adiponectin receptor
MVLLSPRFRAPERRGLRLASCIATGMSAFAPIGHAWYLWGSAHLIGNGVPYYLLEGAFLLAGCYIYQVGVLPRD